MVIQLFKLTREKKMKDIIDELLDIVFEVERSAGVLLVATLGFSAVVLILLGYGVIQYL